MEGKLPAVCDTIDDPASAWSVWTASSWSLSEQSLNAPLQCSMMLLSFLLFVIVCFLLMLL